MRALPPKIHILRFIGEQGIVSVADVTRHFFKPHQFHAVCIALHKLGVSRMQFTGIQNAISTQKMLPKEVNVMENKYLTISLRSHQTYQN